MVLAELGASITSALSKATKSKLDDATLNEILREIATALLSADVNVKLVATLRANVKKRVNLEELGSGLNVERVIHEAVFKELVAILDPGVPKLNPKRGKQNVVLFVGLQGAGKVGAHCLVLPVASTVACLLGVFQPVSVCFPCLSQGPPDSFTYVPLN